MTAAQVAVIEIILTARPTARASAPRTSMPAVEGFLSTVNIRRVSDEVFSARLPAPRGSAARSVALA